MKQLACAVVVALAGAAPALAGLEICNDTSATHPVAIGYKSGDQWISEGWWTIPADECRTLISADLANRYYYFMARLQDWGFAHEDIVFCVTPEVFTITGDENCEARGYETGRFAKIDTGKTARHHTHFLSGYVSPLNAPDEFTEPYADRVTFQDCPVADPGETPFCSFHGAGTKFYVTDDGTTPDYIFRLLETLPPGTPLYVEGELTGIYDTSAEVVLHKAEPQQWDAADGVLDLLQGHWVSLSDPEDQFTVTGAEKTNLYGGQFFGVDYLSVQQQCGEWSGEPPYLYMREEESGEGQCFGLAHVGERDLTLVFLPRGLFQDFRRVD